MLSRFKHVPYYPPKPLLIWDGDCGFCKYWMLWYKNKTKGSVDYEPYQNMVDHIPGIPEEAYMEAIRLIETDGTVYDGPHAAYQALYYTNSKRALSKKYARNPLFRWLSDFGYELVAKNRRTFFKLTKLAWGKDPRAPKRYWLWYLIGFVFLVAMTLIFLFT